VFPAIPTITPFATGCSNGSPIATSQLNCELGECRKLAALELHLAHAREHVPQPVGRTRGSCPPTAPLVRKYAVRRTSRHRVRAATLSRTGG
jgi:hypothetical protein